MTRPRELDPGFDPRLADWLEADPNQAPDQVLDTILAAAPSIPQRRRHWLPWRSRPMNRLVLAGAAIAAVVAVGVSGMLLLPRSGPDPGIGASSSPPPPSPPASPTPSPVDYSTLAGRILVEHLGNAIDRSEMPTSDFNPDRRRFYLMDPATMTADTAVEFMPGQPATGKTAADVSADSRRVVFQDWTPQPRLYEANLDKTGFRRLPIDCECQLLYPDYDPTATRIVYVRIEGDESWLEIYDLESGAMTPLENTRGPAADLVPEQPAWSPDGAMIAFSRLSWDGNEPIIGTVRYGDQPPESGVLSVVDLATGEVQDLPIPAGTLPGDANWYPDSATVLFTHAPASTSGSTANMPTGEVRYIGVDGTGYGALPGWGGPKFIPDGSRILYQNNWFYLMDPDGSNSRPVNQGAMDLTDLAQGFVYIGHWVDAP